jgi:hypothetical protein
MCTDGCSNVALVTDTIRRFETYAQHDVLIEHTRSLRVRAYAASQRDP